MPRKVFCLIFVWVLVLALAIPAGAATVGPLLRSKDGMVVAANPHAARVGAEILEKGGNAVDAAVAAMPAQMPRHGLCGIVQPEGGTGTDGHPAGRIGANGVAVSLQIVRLAAADNHQPHGQPGARKASEPHLRCVDARFVQRAR